SYDLIVLAWWPPGPKPADDHASLSVTGRLQWLPARQVAQRWLTLARASLAVFTHYACMYGFDLSECIWPNCIWPWLASDLSQVGLALHRPPHLWKLKRLGAMAP